MIKRKIAILLALLAFSTAFYGCSGEAAAPETTAAETTASTVTETTAETAPPYEKVDLGGLTIRICTSINKADSDSSDSSNIYIEGPENVVGERVQDAAYERNQTVSDEMNCSVEFTQVDLSYDRVESYFSKIVLAGDDVYDLAINDQYGFSKLAINGIFYNLLDPGYESYFDFDADGWYSDYMTGFMVGNQKMYLLAGDYFIDLLRATHVVYVNTDMFTNLYGDPNELYGIVEDGGWTIDKYTEYVDGAYVDLNGDGTEDAGDSYGLYGNANSGMFSFCFLFSTDISSVTFDSSRIPSISDSNERASKFCDKLLTLYDSRGFGKTVTYNAEMMTKYASGGALFSHFIKLGEVESAAFRAMDNLGIVPYPKADELQDGYHSIPHDTAELGAVPATISADSMSALSAYLQAIAYYSYKDVVVEYFDIALKNKYARDEPTGRMLDIIREGINSPFEVAFGSNYSSIVWTSISKSIEKDTNMFASNYEAALSGAREGLEKLITYLE